MDNTVNDDTKFFLDYLGLPVRQGDFILLSTDYLSLYLVNEIDTINKEIVVTRLHRSSKDTPKFTLSKSSCVLYLVLHQDNIVKVGKTPTITYRQEVDYVFMP